MHILLDADAVNFIDTSACDALSNVTRRLRIQGIAFAFAPVRDKVREQMRLGGVEAAIEPPTSTNGVTDGVRAGNSELCCGKPREVTVSRNLALLADLQELWRLPLRRGNGLRRPEEPQSGPKSQIKSLWRKVATSANDAF